MTQRYHSFSVTFEHTLGGSDQRKVDRAVITVYGESEFAIQAELKRQYPEYGDITILEVEER